MGKVQKISVALPKTMTDMVNRAVKSGEYASASEVIRDALRSWKDREKAKALALAHMRELIQDGVESGRGREIDFDTLKVEMRTEFARRKGKKRLAA
jgi:antitoxin ParD1/3/4